MRVCEALAETKLPDAIKVRKSFVGRAAEAADVKAAIDAELEVWAKFSESGDIKGFGEHRIELVAAPRATRPTTDAGGPTRQGHIRGLGRSARANGSSIITDPLYVWNNTSLPASQPVTREIGGGGECINPDSVVDYIVVGRDFVRGAKSGYTKYQYPHPLAGSAPPANVRGGLGLPLRRR